MQIAQRVFVVTGGGNGIGREVVLGLLARGARVAAVDLSETGLAETARLAAAGDRLSGHVLSIADRTAVEKLPGDVIAEHGQIDGLINVAGIVQRFARVQDLGFDEIERVMAVNFWGVVNTSKVFLPELLARPQSALVNVSSMGALLPVPGQSAYGASKAAVKLLTEGLYAELRGTSVAVTVVFPGGVATDILGNSGVGMPGRDAASAGTGAKLTSPADAAAQIIRAVEKGSFRVRIGGDARLLDRLARLIPQRATALIADRMKSLLDN
ncbi:SDR family NAD(P)-dependent oxidoreductase [Catellatospora coxensis]|uniref:Short-chain dehydrogenase n=1 Tax=Catellatospora coxensis TaxID=310354 RepID=A0A8J3PAY2_9ACTN|nr:SDR family oxidoreductase [Catellatospora coxensis]GIG08306.1 short-chain dehydrogenase [Catellatospora coxensis]